MSKQKRRYQHDDVVKHNEWLDFYNCLKAKTTTLDALRSEELSDLIGLGISKKEFVYGMDDYVLRREKITYGLNPMSLELIKSAKFLNPNQEANTAILLVNNSFEISREFKEQTKKIRKYLVGKIIKSETNILEYNVGISNLDEQKLSALFLEKDQTIHPLYKNDIERMNELIYE